ncbi:unnamed protein product [Aphanomyces euteiches]
MAGGVVGVGEDCDDSARRELEEEMGIRDTSISHVATFSYSSPPMLTWRSLYECVYDGPVTMQEEEVSEVLLMSADEILQRQNEMTPDGIFAFLTYLKSKSQ